ncbi:MAG: hypothetical protein QW734_11595, partial [Candidatus Bathyarchaeia archaeon]
MHVVGYLILLLLAIYFLLIKPYLLARNIEVEIEGVGLSFERGLSFRNLLVYIPLNGRTFHVFVGNGAIRPWDIKAGEFSFIEVSKTPPSDKPFDYDFGPLIEFASKLNLRVDQLYISTNYIPHGESLTLFIPRTELKAGKVYSTGWAQAYWLNHKDIYHIEVFLRKAHTEGRKFVLEQAQVKSDLYEFSLRGAWEGRKGVFDAEGYIEPIHRESFSLMRTKLKLSGSLSYTQIRAGFSGSAETLDIKDRKEFRNLKLEGEYIWKWREKSQLKAIITDSFTKAEVDYSLRDGVLHAVFRGFPVDQRLLGINQSLSAVANGQLELNLKKKLLKLQAYSPMAKFESQEVMNVSFNLTLNYKDISQGSLELFVSQPFLLSVSGSFYGKDFTGSVSLIGYELKQENVSAVVSYDGSLRVQQGQAFSYGGGKLENLLLKDLNLKNANYDLSLEGDNYRINLGGVGYSLSGLGSLKNRDFSGSLKLESMNLSYADIDLESLRGIIDLKVGENRAWGFGR